MAGDYTKFQRHYQNLTTDLAITALTPLTNTLLTVRNANYQIYVQRAVLSVTSFVACTVQLQSASNSVVWGQFTIPATAPTADACEIYTLDYGPTGLGITLGSNLNLVISAANLVASLHIEAYQKAGSTLQGVVFNAQGPGTLT